MGRTSRVLRAALIGFYCTVDLASVASGLISGLQQGVGQVLSTQSQDIGTAVSNAAKLATDAASQQQQAVRTVTSALGGLVPGAQDTGSQGGSPVQQLLQVFQQVTGQAPATDLQSSAIQALRTALNANLLPGPGQGQALSEAAQRLQRAFLPLSPVGAPLPAAMNLLLPAAGAPLPSLRQALPSLSLVPSPLPSLDQLLGNALPALERSSPATQADAVAPELATPPPDQFAAIYIPPLEASTGLAPDTADPAMSAPPLDWEQSKKMKFGPAPAPAPIMMVAPVPAPMLAPAPAPQQNYNVSYAFNITTAAQQALSFAASFNLTTLGGTPWVVAINDTQQFLQDLQLLADPAANANNYLQVLTSARDIFEHSCAKEKVDLPKLVKPYCTGKSMQLSLVPWSCVLDDNTALLSCTPAYLTFSKYADSCTLLDFSEGSIAGKECGLVKPFGLPETEIFGGRKFELKVLEALVSLEKAAGGAVDGPLATIALAAAPLQGMPSSITSAVTTFLGG
ncbi:g2229 [Coccomyxa elongata]